MYDNDKAKVGGCFCDDDDVDKITRNDIDDAYKLVTVYKSFLSDLQQQKCVWL